MLRSTSARFSLSLEWSTTLKCGVRTTPHGAICIWLKREISHPAEPPPQAALHRLSRFPLSSALVITAACRIDRDTARTGLVAESVITIHPGVIRHIRFAVSGREQRRCGAGRND
jgi:hypothetical protein